jgi:hypothetical protein
MAFHSKQGDVPHTNIVENEAVDVTITTALKFRTKVKALVLWPIAETSSLSMLPGNV